MRTIVVMAEANMRGQHQFTSADLWRPGRASKAIAAIIGAFVMLVSFHWSEGYGWAGGVLMAGAALTIPLLQFRKLWSQGRFWITLLLLAALQAPLIILIRPVFERLRAFSLLAFGIGDGLFVIYSIWFVCSGLRVKDE